MDGFTWSERLTTVATALDAILPALNAVVATDVAPIGLPAVAPLRPLSMSIPGRVR